MKNILKQFVEWATLSNQSKFKKAVISLTIYYTIGVFVVLIISNLMVYGLFSNNIDIWNHENTEISFSQEKPEEQLEEDQVKEIQDSLINILIISDILILLITLILSYLSARKTLAPLEEAYKKQMRFVSDAAHELRTPLAVMRAGSEVILRKERIESEYKKFIEESLDEVKRLTTLSNDLLFLAHNDKKKNILMSEISFSEICEKQIEKMLAYASVKNIVLKNDIDKNLIIKGNKDDLIRLVINLLKNAIDYNKPEGIVTLSLKRINNEIILSIIDTGIGIKKENISQIFERFYKVDKSRKQNSSSTGLGLSIVKEIVYEHSGLIKVDSTIDKGTTFTVTFPCI